MDKALQTAARARKKTDKVMAERLDSEVTKGTRGPKRIHKRAQSLWESPVGGRCAFHRGVMAPSCSEGFMVARVTTS